MDALGIEREDDAFGTQTLVSEVLLDDTDLGEELAVLFAAVCGHAKLVEKLGGDEARRAADRCLKRMERAVEMFAGRVVKQMDGELLALFDTADAAAQAAIEIQLRVADLPPVSSIKLGVREAFAFGPVFSSADGFGGAAVFRAATLAGAATAGQVMTSESGADALSPAWQKTLESRGVGPAGEPVFQLKSVLPAGGGDLTAGHAAASMTPAADVSAKRLCLRYRGEVRIFAADVERITLGRDAASDVVVHDRRASRQHAYFERRDGQLMFADCSTNGTVLTTPGHRDVFLRQAERPVQAKGRLSFGGSGREASGEVIEFELI